MRKIIFIFFISFAAFQVKAQNEKTSIAILPFIGGSGGTDNANLIQEMVTKEFVKTERFDIVDRTKFQKVLTELNVQKSEEFLNSKIVDQGKQAGAQYLVTGVLTQMNTQKQINTTSYPSSNTSTLNKTTTTVEWKANIKFTYQVIEVETGKSVYSENIEATNTGAHTANESDASDNAECLLRRQIRHAVMKEFPEEIEIVKVEKTDKKGLPDEVLISAGTKFFDDGSVSECDKGLMDKINIFKKKDVIKLKAYEIEIMTINGKEAKREIQLGILKLKEVQGDFSVCEVTDGAKEIQDKINGNQKILLKIL